MITTVSSIISRKGIVPFMIVDKGIPVTALITKRFRPTGGVSNPNSVTIT